jgi:hypothetical protein
MESSSSGTLPNAHELLQPRKEPYCPRGGSCFQLGYLNDLVLHTISMLVPKWGMHANINSLMWISIEVCSRIAACILALVSFNLLQPAGAV